MDNNFDLEKLLKKFRSDYESKVDSPEDFKSGHTDKPENEQQNNEPYCQWLDDLGWI